MADKVTKCFVVMGSRGEYSDRDDYVVAVFSTREDADKWEQAATKRVRDLQDFVGKKEKEDDEYAAYGYKWRSPFDPLPEFWGVEEEMSYGRGHIEVSYGATTYWVAEAVIDPELPEDVWEEPERRGQSWLSNE